MSPSLAAIRAMVDDQQARLLRAIWSHRLSTGGWIPVRLLHSMQGGKAHVRPQLAGLGGAVVFESEEAGTPTYGLTLLGTLLSDDGARLERLLTDFLALARSLALKEPLRTHVSSTEAAKALGLSHVGIMELGHLIRLSPFHHGGSFGRDEWNVELPRDIEDVPPEPGGYVAQAAVEGYDPAIPLDSSERRIYSSQPRTGLQSISLLAVPPFALPPEEEMARRLTDSLLLSIADDIERKLTRRSFERLLVDRGLYSLSVLSEEMGEYSGLSKRDLIRTVLMELRSGFNTGRLLEALAEEKVLTPDTWQALEEAGYPRPIHREPAKSRAKRPARAPSSATPKKGSTRSGPRARALPKGKRRWDVFLSHASEDKAAIARPLAIRLRKEGLSVWYDDFTLRLGDSLASSIDHGLARSRYGIVIISKSFLDKEWPRKELDALVTKERRGKKVILPVWHKITAAQVRRRSPILASKIAISSSKGLDRVVESILQAMGLLK